jgi:hypothetical protein
MKDRQTTACQDKVDQTGTNDGSWLRPFWVQTKFEYSAAPDGSLDDSPDNQDQLVADNGNHLRRKIPRQQP